MNDETESITGLVFYAIAGICAVILVAAMATGGVEKEAGVGGLVGALMLWWMGKVVFLLTRIANNGGSPTRQSQQAGNPVASNLKERTAKDNVATYRIDR